MDEMSLGSYVRDTVTGFEGVLIGKAEYLYGSIQCQVQPKKVKADGEYVKNIWFERDRLHVISDGSGDSE